VSPRVATCEFHKLQKGSTAARGKHCTHPPTFSAQHVIIEQTFVLCEMHANWWPDSWGDVEPWTDPVTSEGKRK
jgi:hypothetical protein